MLTLKKMVTVPHQLEKVPKRFLSGDERPREDSSSRQHLMIGALPPEGDETQHECLRIEVEQGVETLQEAF
jgi:hypothetical protein